MKAIVASKPIQREPDVVNMLFGSHLYGLDTPASDMDYKGIYLPTLPELLLNNYPSTYKYSTGGKDQKNGAGDIDMEVISLPNFIKHACNGETFALDMLHCETPISESPIWLDLVSKRHRFYSKNMKAYIGYVKKQAAKYGVKGSRLADIRAVLDVLKSLPQESLIGDYFPRPEGKSPPLSKRVFDIQPGKDTGLHIGEYAKWVGHQGTNDELQVFYEVNMKKYQSTNTVEYVVERLTKMWDNYGARAKQAEKNDGVDWKAISHALRAGYQARDIYLKGDFKYPLDETQFILDVKQGKLDFNTEVAPVLEDLVDEVELIAESTELDRKVDREYWGMWLLQQYSKYNKTRFLISPTDTNFLI